MSSLSDDDEDYSYDSNGAAAKNSTRSNGSRRHRDCGNYLFRMQQQYGVGSALSLCCAHLRTTSRHHSFFYASQFDAVAATTTTTTTAKTPGGTDSPPSSPSSRPHSAGGGRRRTARGGAAHFGSSSTTATRAAGASTSTPAGGSDNLFAASTSTTQHHHHSQQQHSQQQQHQRQQQHRQRQLWDHVVGREGALQLAVCWRRWRDAKMGLYAPVLKFVAATTAVQSHSCTHTTATTTPTSSPAASSAGAGGAVVGAAVVGDTAPPLPTVILITHKRTKERLVHCLRSALAAVQQSKPFLGGAAGAGGAGGGAAGTMAQIASLSTFSTGALHLRYFRRWIEWLSRKWEQQQRATTAAEATSIDHCRWRFVVWLQKVYQERERSRLWRPFLQKTTLSTLRRYVQKWYMRRASDGMARQMRRALFLQYYHSLHLVVVRSRCAASRRAETSRPAAAAALAPAGGRWYPDYSPCCRSLSFVRPERTKCLTAIAVVGRRVALPLRHLEYDESVLRATTAVAVEAVERCRLAARVRLLLVDAWARCWLAESKRRLLGPEDEEEEERGTAATTTTAAEE